MAPGRQCEFHAPSLPSAAHKLLVIYTYIITLTLYFRTSQVSKVLMERIFVFAEILLVGF